MSSPLMPIMTACQAAIQGLGLSGLASSNVNIKWTARNLPAVDYAPGIMIAPGDGETYPGIMTQTDDINLPVLIAIVDNQAENFVSNMATYLNWRWLIISRFRYVPIPGIPATLTCYPAETVIIDDDMFAKNILFSPILLRFRTRTTRG